MKTPFQNYLLALRSSVQSFGWIYPISDTFIVAVWLICFCLTLIVLVGGAVGNELSAAVPAALLFAMPTFLLLFTSLLKLRKAYVWMRLLGRYKIAQGRVTDVNQIYIFNPLQGGLGGTGFDGKNSFSLFAIDYNGLPIECIILNRNRQFFDLVGKDVLMKISATNPNIFRVISYADGSPIHSKVFFSYTRANIISIVVIVFALCVAALNIYVKYHPG